MAHVRERQTHHFLLERSVRLRLSLRLLLRRVLVQLLLRFQAQRPDLRLQRLYVPIPR